MSAEASFGKGFRRLLGHLPGRRKQQLVLLLGLMLLGAFAELLSLGAVVPFVTVLASPERAAGIPVVSKAMAVAGLSHRQLPVAVSLVFGILVICAAGVRLALMGATVRFANGLGAEIGNRLYEKTLHRPYSFHVSRNTSEIIGSMNKVQRVIGGYVQPLLTAAIAVILTIAIVGALVAIEPLVALAGAGLFGGSYFLMAATARKRLRAHGATIAIANDQRIRAMQEGLGGIRDVILDRAQDIYSARFARIEDRFRRAQAATQLYSTFPRIAIEALGMLLLAAFALFYVGTNRGIDTLLPVLGAVAVGAQKLMPLVQQIYAGWSSAVSSQPSVDNVLDMLDFEPLPPPEAVVSFKDGICLKSLSFRYTATTDSPLVLHDIDLHIPKGEKLGIVGTTGSGKSTLVDVIMGLLSPTSGSLFVDDQPITDANAAAWQKHIAHVPQSIYLSDASIAENIAFGQSAGSIDRERMERAARCAQIHEDVQALPLGYATVVGERGVRLSGGQRQRIGIARALYKHADILVLDEATSALDEVTEARVVQGIDKMWDDLTVIVIAHRVSTMRGCARIVQLGQGVIRRITTFDAIAATRSADVELTA